MEKILLERRPDGQEIMRIRSCGRDPIDAVFPNHAARDAFLERAERTKPDQPLVSMEDKLGSYLLQELAIWVCGQVGDRDFPHDLWVMAPVYEGGALYLGGHHSSTVLLVRRNDLSSFRDWQRCQAMHVEHRSHGERILTLSGWPRSSTARTAGSERRAEAGDRSMKRRCTFLTWAWTPGPWICPPSPSHGSGSRPSYRPLYWCEPVIPSRLMSWRSRSRVCCFPGPFRVAVVAPW